MYSCQNCSAALRFDPNTQRMICDHCGSSFEPSAVKDTDAAEEEDVFEAHVFRCPQCGGEIVTYGEAAAGFCSYCGAPVMLESRISKLERPDYIIPFKVAKDRLKSIYKKYSAKAFFAPKEMKTPEYLENFRGIYMPYWVYFSDEGTNGNPDNVAVPAEKSYRRGNYIYTDHYLLNGSIEASFEGLSYDASSSFEDRVSEGVKPFVTKDTVPFSPAYMCGFFAETGDVGADVYEDEALDEAASYSRERFLSYPGFSGLAAEDVSNSQFHITPRGHKMALYPLWFLTYRNKDRVSYAVVNGQTGKAAADFPVDLKKYVIASLLLSLPLFVLFVIFPTIKADSMTCVAFLISIITGIVFSVQLKSIMKRETHEDDRGYEYKKKKSHGSSGGAGDFRWDKTENKNEYVRTRTKNDKKVVSKKGNLSSGTVIGFIIGFIIVFNILIDSVSFAGVGIFILIASFIAWIVNIFLHAKAKKLLLPDQYAVDIIFPAAVNLAAMVLYLMKIHNDTVYYCAATLIFCGEIMELMALIKLYNRLTTHPLPQNLSEHDRMKAEAGDEPYIEKLKDGQPDPNENHPFRAFLIIAGTLIIVISSFVFLDIKSNEAASKHADRIIAENKEEDTNPYINTSSGYTAYVSDKASLFSESEIKNIIRSMSDITEYCNAALFTVDDTEGYTTSQLAKRLCDENFGQASSTVFIIDMDNRQLYIYSGGSAYSVITSSRANDITGNVYRMASQERYAACAEAVFAQETALFKGKRIAQPMKFLSCAFLSFIMSFGIMYLITLTAGRIRKAGMNEVMSAAYINWKATGMNAKFIHQTRVYDPPSSSGGSGGGGSGGGGSSGGGGGHGF